MLIPMVHSLAVPVLVVTMSGATAMLAGAGLAGQVSRERTLVGCIERADPNTVDLLLTHAGDEPRSPRADAGAGAGAGAKNDATYRLTSTGHLKLDDLVGHKVRIVGRIEKEAPRTGGPVPAVTADERAGRSTEKRGDDAPTFRARTVHSIAITCHQ